MQAATSSLHFEGNRLRSICQEHGSKIAVKDEDRAVTYCELAEKTRQLASAIHRDIPLPERSVVAIAMQPGLDFVLSLLSALELGALVVPLDTAFPNDRILEILKDSSAEFILCSHDFRQRFQAHSMQWNLKTIEELLEQRPECDELPLNKWKGVLLYTSGSSGKPKGVVLSGKMLVREAVTLNERLNIDASDRLSHLLSPSVIGGLREILSSLFAAATLVPLRTKDIGLQALIDRLTAEEITVCRLVSSLFRTLCHVLPTPHSMKIRKVYIGGEPLLASDLDLFKKHFPQDCRLDNIYGATEFGLCTHAMHVDQCHIGEAKTVPIGIPNPGYHLKVTDDLGNEVAPGESGLLVVAGECIAEGYWKGSLEQIEPFEELREHPGWRVFRTADRVRWDSQGRLEYLGRADSQVKILGNRIELSEIEEVLRRAEGVLDAVAINLQDEHKQRVYAVVQYVQESEMDLVPWCKQHLPAPVVPLAIFPLAALPKTLQGKCDRKAVEAIILSLLKAKEDEAHLSPKDQPFSNERVEHLIRLWKQACQLPQGISIESTTRLQTDSLSALEFLILLRKELHIELTPSEFRMAESFGELVSILEEKFHETKDAGSQSVVDSQCIRFTERNSGPPLFLLHSVAGECSSYRSLADHWTADTTLVGVQANRECIDSMEEIDLNQLARIAVRSIRKEQASGPYLLAGYSFGGVLAYEVARELQREGEVVAYCGLIDSFVTYKDRYSRSLAHYFQMVKHFPSWLNDSLQNNLIQEAWMGIRTRKNKVNMRLGLRFQSPIFNEAIVTQLVKACDHYQIAKSEIPIWYYRSKVRPLLHSYQPENDWKRLTKTVLRCRVVPGNHESMMHPPHAIQLSKWIAEDIAQAMTR